jgi:hypothetical protein
MHIFLPDAVLRINNAVQHFAHQLPRARCTKALNRTTSREAPGLHTRGGLPRQCRYYDVRLRQTEMILGLVALSGS